MGGTYTLNGATVATKGGNRCGINCEAYGSPVAWSESLPNNGGQMQFIVWGQSKCIAGTNGRIELNYGKFSTLPNADSPWNAMRFTWQNRWMWGAITDDMSSTPAVFSLDDNKIDTTRIVTLSEQGGLRLDSLKMVGAQPQNNLEYFDNSVFDFPTTYPIISPVVYRDPFWGDGPDAGINPDSYAFVPHDHVVWVPADNRFEHQITVHSYDLYDSGQGNVPRYSTEPLNDRKLTMSTPAIVTQQYAWKILAGAWDAVIASNPWKPDPFNPGVAPPVFAGPGWINPQPQWPAGVVFNLVAQGQKAYLLLITTDTNNANPRLAAFDINPNNLNANGQYPKVWEVALDAVSNTAVAASDNALFWHPGTAVLSVDRIASFGLENGKLAVVSDIMTANPHIDYVAIETNTPSALRSTPSFANGHVIVPWSDQRPPLGARVHNELEIDLVDLGAQVGAPAKKFAQPLNFLGTNNKPYELDRNVMDANGNPRGRDLVTASGVFDNTGEQGQQHYYIGVRDRDNGGPHVGLLWIDWAWLNNGAPGQKGFTLAPSFTAQYHDGEGGFTDWILYSSPALVSENEALSKSYVVLGAYMYAQTIDFTINGVQYHGVWTKEGELFTFNS